MKKTMLTILVGMAVLIGISTAGWGADMGTEITYQGRLSEGGGPADGAYDFEFELYDDPCVATGSLVSGTITMEDVEVTGGLFTVALDFGSDVFDGDARWLQIGVRPGDSGGSFTTLSPRQEVTPTPYALQTRGIFVDSSRNVGIGTTNPGEKLEISLGAGSGNIAGFSAINNTRFLISVDGVDSDLSAQSGNNLKLGTSFSGTSLTVLNSTGNVGIGTVGPSAKLDVVGNTELNGNVDINSDLDVDAGTLHVDGTNNRVGIGTTSPSAKLDVEVSSGGAATIGSSGNSATGDYAIATGYYTDASGFVSTAMGYITDASGFESTAMGNQTTASNDYSTAMGAYTDASGNSSTAMGYSTTASNYYSTAMGAYTTASGLASTAMGRLTTASGYASTAMGREIEAQGDYSVAIALNDQNGEVVSQANTMAIMGGNVGIGTTSPSAMLEIGSGGDLLLKGSGADPGDIIFQTSTGTQKVRIWASPATDSLYLSGSDNAPDLTVNDSGVGIGMWMTSPARSLHVSDVMRLEPRDTVPSSPSAGDIYFDSNDNKLKCYDGSTWQACW